MTESFRIQWSAWHDVLAAEPSLNAVARPALLAHLRAVDAAQFADTPATLALDGHDVTPAQATGYLARRAPKAAAAGWPGPVPPVPPVPPMAAGADRAAIAGYASALTHVRLTILALLQGAEAVPALAAAYPALRLRCLGLAYCEEHGMGAELAEMWELAGGVKNTAVRAALLHLGVLRCEVDARGAGRLARLVMNTVRAAGGHPWLSVPVARHDEYVAAVRAALDARDARPWAGLLAALAPNAD